MPNVAPVLLPTSKTDTNYTVSKSIVSSVAYLIGVNERYFTEDPDRFALSDYRRLNLRPGLQLIRKLCILRNEIMQNFTYIRRELIARKPVSSLHNVLSVDLVEELAASNISVFPKNTSDLLQVLVNINAQLQTRSGNLLPIFPDWVEKRYLQALVIMPKGKDPKQSKKQAQEESQLFRQNMENYPYHCYINLSLVNHYGLILKNDEFFLRLLYEQNNDRFEAYQWVRNYKNTSLPLLELCFQDALPPMFLIFCELADYRKTCGLFSAIRELAAEKKPTVKLFYSNHNQLPLWRNLQRVADVALEEIKTQRSDYFDQVLTLFFTLGFDASDIPLIVFIGTPQELVNSSSDSQDQVYRLFPEKRCLLLANSYEEYDALRSQPCSIGSLEDFRDQKQDLPTAEEMLRTLLPQEPVLNISDISSLISSALAHVSSEVIYDQSYVEALLRKKLCLVFQNGEVYLRLPE